jgi:hypothetical protein
MNAKTTSAATAEAEAGAITPQTPATAPAAGVPLQILGAVGLELRGEPTEAKGKIPTDNELARRPKAMVFDRLDRAWVWRDPQRRAFLARPNVHEIVAAAVRAFSVRVVARRLGIAPQTVLAVGGNFDVLGITLSAVGYRVADLADLGEELP